MSEHNAVVGIYNSHTDAEAAIKALQKSGFDMQKLSIAGKDYQTEEHVIGFYNAGDRMQFWGIRGALWGWLGGLLVGAALFVIPGLGPVIVFGPLVGGLVGAMGGAVVVGGLSALGAGLYSIGIPKDSIMEYETALKADKFLVMASGTANEVATAKRILETTGAAYITAHEGVFVPASTHNGSRLQSTSPGPPYPG